MKTITTTLIAMGVVTIVVAVVLLIMLVIVPSMRRDAAEYRWQEGGRARRPQAMKRLYWRIALTARLIWFNYLS